jgi:small subunit ribosomal protein S6
MNLYENVFIGRQDLSQQQIEALGANLGLFVTQNGGEIARSEYCGFRTLAYPIKKNHKGHYYVIQMKAPVGVVAELNRTMSINEDIVRHLIVKVEDFDNRDTLISQVKTFSDDFGGMGRGGERRERHGNRGGFSESEAGEGAPAEIVEEVRVEG